MVGTLIAIETYSVGGEEGAVLVDEIPEKGSCLVPPSWRGSDTGYSRVEMSHAIASPQLSTGVEYLVTVKIGRTKCKKSEASNASCPLQSSKLKKVCCGDPLREPQGQGWGVNILKV